MSEYNTFIALLHRAEALDDPDLLSDVSAVAWISARHKVLEHFRWACAGGKLRLAQYFWATIGVTAQEARSINNYALHRSCQHGHLHVARWLHVTFGLTPEDAKEDKNAAIRWACGDGQLEAAKWLCATFSLTQGDVTACNNYGLRTACNEGHLHIVQWLFATFPDTKRGMSPSMTKYHRHVNQCLTISLGYSAGNDWSRKYHHLWYWQPQVIALAASLNRSVLIDVIRRVARLT